MAKYSYNSQPVNLTFGYLEAYRELPKYGLDLLSIFDAENTVIQKIMLDDRVMLDVRFYFLKREGLAADFEESLEDFTSVQMQQFREAFWEEVVNFSAPPARKALREMWTEAKRQLNSVDRISTSSSSNSSEDQD